MKTKELVRQVASCNHGLANVPFTCIFILSLRFVQPYLDPPPSGFSSATPGVINLLKPGDFQSNLMRHILVKKGFSDCFHVTASPFVHECSANFRSLFSPFLLVFRQNCQKSQIFAKNCDFLSFKYFFSAKFCPGGGATFNFWPIRTDFQEYTSNMTSYHVAEAINGYF